MTTALKAIFLALFEWLFRRLSGPVMEYLHLKKRFKEIEAENRVLRERLERAETELEREIATRETAKGSF